jgi:hypothetical protein
MDTKRNASKGKKQNKGKLFNNHLNDGDVFQSLWI